MTVAEFITSAPTFGLASAPVTVLLSVGLLLRLCFHRRGVYMLSSYERQAKIEFKLRLK
jgi:hypothetical protein